MPLSILDGLLVASGPDMSASTLLPWLPWRSPRPMVFHRKVTRETSEPGGPGVIHQIHGIA